ncbi:MAG TPA: hypothetical protein DEO70_10375 [Bacteroidales bacterium]|nr:MAG: hypothetical protein A2X11_06335 [Bacteroidetes bacterium GWE2_42_24]OFY29890.1 MAG: hypothetical protein A2X09_16305 [Bacteroidetes bacterium GWF2_43_11]HBZ67234.1 hypothetical protein [Bacteroidales bacterium]
MKKQFKFFYILVAMVATTFLGGCVKEDFDTPPTDVPSYDPSSDSVVTIAQLKTLYTGVIENDSITDNLTIKGVVVSSDEEGNFYQVLAIQDETGGIQILLEPRSLYLHYRVGQTVYVKCMGLHLSAYGSLIQLGNRNIAKLSEITTAEVSKYLFRDGLPTEVVPVTHSSASTITINSDDNTYVRLTGVKFRNAGSKVVPSSDDSDQAIVFKDGTEIIMRTSSYTKFAKNILPNDTGTIYGVITRYNDKVQLVLNHWGDLHHFSFEQPLFIETFSAGLGSFKSYSVLGAQAWTTATYDDGCALMSGYASSSRFPNEDWLISPQINLTGRTDAIMNVYQAVNYVDGKWENIQVMISSDYDGTSDPSTQGTWTELTIPNRPIGTSWDFVSSGDISLAAFANQKVYIGFKYRSTSSVAASWEIGSVSVK